MITRLAGMAILMASVAGVAFGGLSVPEIDSSSAVAAVGLVAGGLLILRSRRGKR